MALALLVALALPASASAHAARRARTHAAPAGELVIHGGGLGHGIGMSQYGAEGYALHGYAAPAILAHYYTGTALGQAPAGRVVRVLLSDGSASFSGATTAGSTALSAARTYRVIAPAGGGVAVLSRSGRVLARASQTLTVTGPLTVSGPAPLTTAGRSYRGVLQFTADAHGGVLTVDAVGLEDYVRGVVAGEMPSGWAPAALQAQAIAARTYALTGDVGASAYDVYDDTRSQMYGGVSAETPATDAAVAATAGEIVTYGGAPATTYFFASSGGYTESIQNAWPGAAPEPWLRGVPDPYDGAAGDPYHSWTVTMTLARAASRLGRLVKGTLTGIVVTRTGVSPRIVQAVVQGSGGTTTVTGAQLQQSFGLDSTYAAFAVTG